VSPTLAARPAASPAAGTGRAPLACRVCGPHPRAAGSPPASPPAVGTSRLAAPLGSVATARPEPQATPPRSSRRSRGGLRSAAHAAGPRGEAPAPRPVPSGPPPHPECPVPMLQPRLHPSAPRRAARAALPGRGRGPPSGAPACPPFGPSARARGPTMPSADCCLPVSGNRSPRSPGPGCRMRYVFSVSAWFPGGDTRWPPYLRHGRPAELPE
jgi:hypothetical protein